MRGVVRSHLRWPLTKVDKLAGQGRTRHTDSGYLWTGSGGRGEEAGPKPGKPFLAPPRPPPEGADSPRLGQVCPRPPPTPASGAPS